MTNITIQLKKEFQRYLLNWYDENARLLPWRDDPTPYRVWISEIMLQQTRVEAVKPFFDRFLSELPTVRDLANVEEQSLLKLWEGLGYYSRAKNLRKAALEIVQRFEGQVPSDIEALLSLPGIGPYTAGAIASIAFGARTPAIDGNVLRVVARLTANRGDPSKKETRAEIEGVVLDLLPNTRNGDFNQALMELGATVCLPNGAPKCESCPVYSLCGAYSGGLTGEIPAKTVKKARRVEERTVIVLHCNNRTAIVKRPDTGLLGGLWELPNLEGSLSAKQCKKILEDMNIPVIGIEPLPKAKHIFSHVEWHMTGYLVRVELPGSEDISWVPGNLPVWASPDELRNRFALPAAFKAYMPYALGSE